MKVKKTKTKTKTRTARIYKVYDELENLVGVFGSAKEIQDILGVKTKDYIYKFRNTNKFFSKSKGSDIKYRVEYEKVTETYEVEYEKEYSYRPLKYTYHAMKQRCYDPNHMSYKYYGAKGVEICEQWIHDYKAFETWCFANGWKKGMNVSRFGDVGNYSPDNCQILTKKENIKRTKGFTKPPKAVKLHKDGEVFEFDTMNEAADFLGATIGAVSCALNDSYSHVQTVYGWAVEGPDGKMSTDKVKPPRKTRARRQAVRITKDGKSFEFKSIAKAAEFIGTSGGGVSNAANPDYPNCYTAAGWTVERIEKDN